MSIEYVVENEIVTITINRPERRNAVDLTTSQALYDAFVAFDNDATLSVAILTGEGDNFCAGADLQSIADGKPNKVDVDGNFGPMGPSRLRLSKPVIAAVEGYAVAGGLELALWCDLRVASRAAKFGVFCRRFGVPLVDLGTIRLPRLIGQSRAADMILTGREVNAEEAQMFGLVNRLVDEGQSLAAAKQLAREIAKHPQTCMRNDRRSMYEQWDLTERAAIKNELRLGQQTMSTGETVDGASAFKSGEGRHGVF